MRLSLLISLALAACSSSEARDLIPPTEPTKISNAPKPVEPAPPVVSKPEAPAPAPAAPSPVAPSPVPLTQGNSPNKLALRTLEKLANAIDAANDDCVALARNLTPLAADVKKATNRLAEHGQQFKTLRMSPALRDRQKAQRALVKHCKTTEPLAKTAIARSIGAIQSYDFGYGGDHDGAVYY